MPGTDEVRKAQAGSGEEEELTVLARKHDACYEIWPAQTVLAGRKVAAGFELELLGVNEAHGPPQAPGCPRCEDTYRDLHRIAVWLLAPPPTAARVEVAHYDASWHESPARSLRPEVALTIHIGPAAGLGAPVDSGVRDVVAALESALGRLGSARGR
jgi:hypothetical protein